MSVRKIAIGRRMWLHEKTPCEGVIISSHGSRDANNMRTIALNEFVSGTTITFVIPDGTPSAFPVRQSIEGGMSRHHTAGENRVVFDYYLTKFQGSSRKGERGAVRNTEEGRDSNETYNSIAQALESQYDKTQPGAARERAIRSNNSAEKFNREIRTRRELKFFFSHSFDNA